MAIETDERAARAESFNRRYWYADGGYLYDVIDGEGGNDPASPSESDLRGVARSPRARRRALAAGLRRGPRSPAHARWTSFAGARSS